MSDQPTSLYRFYDAEDRLLYVGITNHLMRRTTRHAADKPWFSAVARSEVDHYPTRAAALAREAELIRELQPVHNIQGRGRLKPYPEERTMSPDKGRADRLTVAVEAKLDPHRLVGSFFHSKTDEGKIQWQGCVVAEPSAGYYLVELFSWVMGESTEQRLIRIEDMAEWSFYDDAKWMNNAYQDQP